MARVRELARGQSVALDPEIKSLRMSVRWNAARWQRLTEWPLTGAAVIFLVIYAWSVLGDLQGPLDEIAQAVITITWAMFVVDYVARLVLAERRWRWFGRHLLDLVIVALPILRPLRLIRLVTLFAIFQRVAGRTLRGRVVLYTAVSTALLVFVGALAMLDAERNYPDSSITTFGGALWWARTTMTTVGYGDLYPVSVTGRCVAVAVMLGGIALLGTITATIASWLVERVAEQQEESQAATRHQVNELSRKVEMLHDLLLRTTFKDHDHTHRSRAHRLVTASNPTEPPGGMCSHRQVHLLISRKVGPTQGETRDRAHGNAPRPSGIRRPLRCCVMRAIADRPANDERISVNRYLSLKAVGAASVVVAALLTGCTGRTDGPLGGGQPTVTSPVTSQFPDPAAVSSSVAAASNAQLASSAAGAEAVKSKAQQSSLKAAAASASQRSVAEQAAKAAAEQSAAEAAAAAKSAASESAKAQAAAEQSAAEQSAAERSAAAESSAQQAASEQSEAEQSEVERADPEQAADDAVVAGALAEGWYTPNGNYVSPETAARAMAAGISPGETVPNYLRCGTICGEGPTSGEVQQAQLCLQGTVAADECVGIDAQAIIDAASSYGG